MLSINKIKMLPVLGLVLLAFMLPGKSAASDLDVFGVLTEDVAPNILIIFDTSGSMGDKDVLNSKGVLDTRLQVAKDAVINLIDTNPNMRWGLMVFPGSSSAISGTIKAECKERTTSELTALKNTIKNLTALGGTPVASALAEAGLYFAGDKSFFWGTQYTTPIQNYCQANYIILITDGFSSVDSGMKTYYTNTSEAARYNLATRDIIFFKDPYITNIPGKSIDSLTRGGYITWKTFGAPGAERVRIGEALAPFTYNLYFKSALNAGTNTEDVFKGTYNAANVTDAGTSVSWQYVDTGCTAGTLVRNQSLKKADITALAQSDQPYIYGYNATDPSRPIPPLTITYNAAGTATYITLVNQGYIQNTQIFQGNIWGAGAYASDYLDDVAAFLHNEDLLPSYQDPAGKYKKQSVKTFTIGFMFSSDLLERAAIMGGSGGLGQGYFTADNALKLNESLTNIVTGIKEEMSVYAPPSVPANNESSAYSGKYMYMSMFKPAEDVWLGNVKKYRLNANNSMSDYLDEDGYIKAGSTSVWSSSPDGGEVTAGSVAAKIDAIITQLKTASPGNAKDIRKVYTYIKDNGKDEISHSNNLVWENNPKLTADMLGMTGSKSDLAATINEIRQRPMGAVIHSSPTVAYYSSGNVVFVGAQDGFLHAIDDNNGNELWAFVSPQHLATIKDGKTLTPNDGLYFVDGSISIKTFGSKKILLFGARRGGTDYVALDITSKDDPKFAYQISSTEAPWKAYNLGLSWGAPAYVKVPGTIGALQGAKALDADGCLTIKHAKLTGLANAAILPGGYDARYDNLKPSEITNPKGGAVLGFNSLTGAQSSAFAELNATKSSFMKHAVVDLVTLDMNRDNYIDTIYYGDMGGKFFYAMPYTMSVDGGTCNGAPKRTYTADSNGKFHVYKLFETDASADRSFMYAPVIVKAADGGEYAYLGTGNREWPFEDEIQNRFYCIKNINKQHLSYNSTDTFHLTEVVKPGGTRDLSDVTANLIQTGTDAQKQTAQNELNNTFGWFMDLLPAEKVVAKVAVYDGVVYFTTYQPTNYTLDPTDVCKSSSTGIARLYMLNYLDGSSSIPSGDRFIEIGKTITGGPIMEVFEDGSVKLFVVVGDDGLKVLELNLGNFDINSKVFFWREIY